MCILQRTKMCNIWILVALTLVAGITSCAAVDVNEKHAAILKCPLNDAGQYPKWTGPKGLASPLTNGQTIMEQGIEWVNDTDIKIKSAQLKHDGHYTCEDGKGNTGTVELDVQYFIASALYSDASSKNTTAVLTCTVHSNPASKIVPKIIPGHNYMGTPVTKFQPCGPNPKYENRTTCSMTAAMEVSIEYNGAEIMRCDFIYKNHSQLTWNPKVSFVFPPSIVNVTEKQQSDKTKVTLTCSTDSSNPVASLIWRKGTYSNISRNDRIYSRYKSSITEAEYNGHSISQDIDIRTDRIKAGEKGVCCAHYLTAVDNDLVIEEYCDSINLEYKETASGVRLVADWMVLLAVCIAFFTVRD